MSPHLITMYSGKGALGCNLRQCAPHLFTVSKAPPGGSIFRAWFRDVANIGVMFNVNIEGRLRGLKFSSFILP